RRGPETYRRVAGHHGTHRGDDLIRILVVRDPDRLDADRSQVVDERELERDNPCPGPAQRERGKRGVDRTGRLPGRAARRIPSDRPRTRRRKADGCGNDDKPPRYESHLHSLLLTPQRGAPRAMLSLSPISFIARDDYQRSAGRSESPQTSRE